MISKFNYFIPLALGILASLLSFFVFKLINSIVKEARLRSERSMLLLKYNLNNKRFQNKNKTRTQSAKTILNQFGTRIVKDRYKDELEKLIISSGETENNNLNRLIEKKSFFALGGLLLTFTFAVLRNPEFIPITFAIVILSYLYPNLEYFIKKIRKSKYRIKLDTLLAQSGANDEMEYFSFYKRKLLSAFLGFLFSYLYLLAKNTNFSGFSISLLAVFLGFFLPDLLLQNKVLKRKIELANTLPDAIDMLQMCVNAGLAFPAALTKISETQSGAIAEEFARVTAEVQLGKSRQEALYAMAMRTREPNIAKFANSMTQVERFGIPIGNVLTEQSKEMRSRRRDNARERAQKVPIKILAPIMLCFLPTILIIVLGPAFIMLTKTLAGN